MDTQQTASLSRPRILSAIALVSFASLLLELALTRLFSVVLFYHFAFLAISVALLGLGAGGVFSYVKREWLERFTTREIGFWLSAINAVLILLVLQVVLRVPISLDLTWANFGKLTILYLASAVPFFFVGLLFSVVFAREARGIGVLYGADLVGGALACLAVVPLLNWIGGPNAVLAASAAMGVAALLWAETKRAKLVASAVVVVFVALIGANYSGKLIDIVYAKGQRRDQPWMLFAKWNAISRVEVNQVGLAKYIVIDADASTAIMNVDPANWEKDIAVAGANLTAPTGEKDPAIGERRGDNYNWKRDLMSAAPAIANVLRPNGKYAIIGPGGGVDVLRAVANGSKDVTGIEINPIIADDIMRGNHADYSYNLYRRPEVRIHVGDGRSFIRNSKEQYDVIQMTLVDTWASTAAGAFALSENNLYTVEAFEEYFQHLKPDGMIAITRWEFKEPREALRVVSQGIEALRRSGITDVRQHFLVVSDGALDVDGRPVLVLVKKTPFVKDEEQQVNNHLSKNPSLHPLYLPTELHEAIPSQAKDLRRAVSEGRYSVPHSGDNAFHRYLSWTDSLQSSFVWGYPYNISPVYDKNPFFFFTLKTGDVLKKIMAGTGRGMDWRINLGVTVLFMVFGISIVAVLAFLILPLLLHNRRTGETPVPHRHARLLYFIAVGLGFIIVEITLIQRFVLFLGHPTYALTVVVFLMLLASGAGSFMAKKWLAKSSSVRVPLALIAAIVIAYLYLLPLVLGAMIGAEFAVKLLISGALIVPLGVLMGIPFPTGLRALDELDDRRVEWAWALNGGATVLGSVSSMIIAIHFGLNVTLVVGAMAYVVALLLVGSFRTESD